MSAAKAYNRHTVRARGGAPVLVQRRAERSPDTQFLCQSGHLVVRAPCPVPSLSGVKKREHAENSNVTRPQPE
jgi:hypothetical protein